MYYAAEAAGLEVAAGSGRATGFPRGDLDQAGRARDGTYYWSSPSREAAEAFGAALATMHASGAEGFSVGPPTAPGSG